MPVSLVKVTPATIVYTVGHSMSGYLPDPDSVSVAVTIADARSILADELDRLADFLADTELHGDTAELDYVSAMVETVKRDGDGDIAYAIAHHGGWSTQADDESYWVQSATLADVYGDDTESDEYLDTVDALRSI